VAVTHARYTSLTRTSSTSSPDLRELRSSNNACLARLGSTVSPPFAVFLAGLADSKATVCVCYTPALSERLGHRAAGVRQPDGRPTAAYQVLDACVRHAARARGRPGGSCEYLKNATAAWDGTLTDMVADLTLGAVRVDLIFIAH